MSPKLILVMQHLVCPVCITSNLYNNGPGNVLRINSFVTSHGKDKSYEE